MHGLLETEAHVVVAGGIAEERRLRIAPEEVERQQEAEGEEREHGRRPHDAAARLLFRKRGRGARAPFVEISELVRRGRYLPAARTSVAQLWSPQLKVSVDTPPMAGASVTRKRSAAPVTAPADVSGTCATSLSFTDG